MKSGFTNDPNVALTGLLSISLLGVLVVGGGLAIAGVLEGSWFQVAGGALLAGYLSWMVWQAGRVVRHALKAAEVKEDPTASQMVGACAPFGRSGAPAAERMRKREAGGGAERAPAR